MKKYGKVQVTSVNAPSGSYAAGCPVNHRPTYNCQTCEIAK